ncbi:hypothetical protein GCM10023339_27850 [Alloalcanivorax gelatiniphagus]
MGRSPPRMRAAPVDNAKPSESHPSLGPHKPQVRDLVRYQIVIHDRLSPELRRALVLSARLVRFVLMSAPVTAYDIEFAPVARQLGVAYLHGVDLVAGHEPRWATDWSSGTRDWLSGMPR